MIVDLDYKLLHPDARAPVLASDGAACFDLHAYMPTMQSAYVLPGETVIVHTGIAFAFPKGWCMEVYSRSGHGAKCRVSLANSTGIIDSDYRGELLIALTRREKGPRRGLCSYRLLHQVTRQCLWPDGGSLPPKNDPPENENCESRVHASPFCFGGRAPNHQTEVVVKT